MRRSFIYSFSLVFLVSFLLVACKGNDKRQGLLGKWQLIMWKGQQVEAEKGETPGTFVFLPDSTVYTSINYFTEIGKYSIHEDTLRVVRVGGTMSYLSAYDYWMIRKLDSVFFNIVSNDGNYVTAYKPELFYGKPKQDTAVVEL